MNFSRRHFLSISLGTGSMVWLLPACTQSAPENIDPTQFTASEHDALHMFIQQLFPINNLDASVLSELTAGLIQSEQSNSGLRESLKSCIAALQDRSGNKWLKLKPINQVAIMTQLESEPWFTAILLQAKASLFTAPKLWARLNYGGSSLEQGGYKYNGFDDIDWLPESPE